MKAAPVVAGSILASAGVAFLVATVMSPEPPAPVDPAAALRGEFLAIRQGQEAFRAELAALETRLESLASAASRTAIPEISAEQLERAVARVMADQGEPVEAVADAPEGELDMQAIYMSLLGATPDQFPEVWARVKEAGKLGELLAMFEAYATANPNLPQAHLDLGNAYLQQLMSMTPGPQSGVVATQAEDAFSRVLEIDPNHWEARFTRAVSFTFWPDFLGKKQQAIDQFEVLIGQQEALPPQPHFAQTYLFLGNLHEQRGDLEKAAEAWKKGLTLYPTDADLLGKVK